jgi:hypothetical protein
MVSLFKSDLNSVNPLNHLQLHMVLWLCMPCQVIPCTGSNRCDLQRMQYASFMLRSLWLSQLNSASQAFWYLHKYFFRLEGSCNNVAPVKKLVSRQSYNAVPFVTMEQKKSCSWNIKTHYLRFKHFIITITDDPSPC